MFRRHIRKEAYHERPDQSGQQGEHPTLFSNLHQAQKQRHYTYKANGKFNRTRSRFNVYGVVLVLLSVLIIGTIEYRMASGGEKIAREAKTMLRQRL